MKRREFLKVSAVGAAAAAVASPAIAQSSREIKRAEPSKTTRLAKSFFTTKEQATIFYKDWGPRDAQPVCFHHGWPTSSDDWDNQMLFFLNHGFRCIAHDRRGHGRSGETEHGNDMDTYVADVIALAAHLDLRNAVHIGHSAGGGEIARYAARAEKGRVAKAAMIGAVPPIMLRTDKNPGGLPMEVFDDFRKQFAANRAQFLRDFASGPVYGFNRPGVAPIPGTIDNWWRQGMMGSAKAQYEGIKVFSETDFTEDLKALTVPVLIMHSDDDQVVPIEDSSLLSAKLVKNATLKVYKGYSHGMALTHADVINADLLAFIRS
ncbi:non-heme chloroperoxidase [Bradyrhizobium sp. S3.12.5]|uniref:alpha/beta fold hydrolase n=1 Tax=Bradyrhizobium sp. S3.12.5 TaxID=3156386 RepID=UPI0033931FF6